MIYKSNLNQTQKIDYISSIFLYIYDNIDLIYNKEKNKFILTDNTFEKDFFKNEMTPIEYQNAVYKFLEYVISTEEGCKKFNNTPMCDNIKNSLENLKNQIDLICPYLDY
jgi:hypothetical protein